jgi:hypothetical protein
MGRITTNNNTVIVEMTVDEAIALPTYIKLPEDERLWHNHLADLIVRAAGTVLHKNAPHLSKTYDVCEVHGSGNIKVIFKEKS